MEFQEELRDRARFWKELKSIYPVTGVSYQTLQENTAAIRILFSRYKYEINSDVVKYLTFLQENTDIMAYNFLEGLKDSLVPFLTSSKTDSRFTAKQLVSQFKWSSRKSWVANLYQSTVHRMLISSSIIVDRDLTETENAYLYGAILLF